MDEKEEQQRIITDLCKYLVKAANTNTKLELAGIKLRVTGITHPKPAYDFPPGLMSTLQLAFAQVGIDVHLNVDHRDKELHLVITELDTC